MSSLNQSVIVTDICHFSGFLAFESISKFGETPYLWVLVGCFNHFSLKKWETPATPILAYQKSEASNLGLANLPQTLESGSRNRCKEAETMGSPFWWRVRSAASQSCLQRQCLCSVPSSGGSTRHGLCAQQQWVEFWLDFACDQMLLRVPVPPVFETWLSNLPSNCRSKWICFQSVPFLP